MRTSAKEPLGVRVQRLHDAAALWVEMASGRDRHAVTVVMEEPEGFVSSRARRDPRTVHALGVGVGAVLAGLMSAKPAGGVQLVSPSAYLPRVRRGRGLRFADKGHNVWAGRALLPREMAANASEHVCMAALLAHWWLHHYRLTNNRR